MTNGLSNGEKRFLTYLVYVLLAIITIITGYHAVTIHQMPDKYVLLERYNCDALRLQNSIDRLDDKLDRLIERQIRTGALAAPMDTGEL